MTINVSSVICAGPGFAWPSGSANGVLYLPINNWDNRMTPCEAYQKALNQAKADVICMCHDDVTVHDTTWVEQILSLFEHNPDCVAVGPGGAVGLGNRDLYRKRWDIRNMARIGYASNQDDAEVHGERFTGVRRVAVLEQFMMAVRVDWLRSKGGWPVGSISHHMIDAWLACEASRDGKEIWQTAFACHHSGGQSSTSPLYREAKWLMGGTMEQDHIRPHVWIADTYRDVLPIEVAQ